MANLYEKGKKYAQSIESTPDVKGSITWMHLIDTCWYFNLFGCDAHMNLAPKTGTGNKPLLCQGECRKVIFLPVCIVFSLMHFAQILMLAAVFVSVLLLLVLSVVSTSGWVAL